MKNDKAKTSLLSLCIQIVLLSELPDVCIVWTCLCQRNTKDIGPFDSCRACPTCPQWVAGDTYYGPDLEDDGGQLYAVDADECCVACLLRAQCAAWVLLEESTATLHRCMLISSVEYIMLTDSRHPGYAVYSGGRNNTAIPQVPPPPPGDLPGPRYVVASCGFQTSDYLEHYNSIDVAGIPYSTQKLVRFDPPYLDFVLFKLSI
jgi:hypothetical protein